MNRETIMAALFAQALTAGTFPTSGRRLRMWSEVTIQFPALFIRTVGMHYSPREAGKLQKRTIHAEIWLYVKSDPATAADTEAPVNNLLDALETALAPSSANGLQTLGGLVRHCWIEGVADQYPALLDGIAKAVIPVRILIP